MWGNDFDTGNPTGSRNQDRRDQNFDRLLTVGLAIALALYLASLLPAPLIAPFLREFLLWGAYAACCVAALRREPVFPEEITAWDQAAALALIGLLCGLLVNSEAASSTLNELLNESRAAPI